ncbi:MAG TPA: proline dehydrogenase family protein [Candidatus Acidoferrales bacterium]|nr:proline dehydrogenase family protein [Candidatus Acidoferrales bacterium]
MPLMRDLVFWLSTKKAFTGPIARTGMRLGFAKRFIAGETLEDGLRAAAELNAKGLKVIMNRLGENVTDRREAEESAACYREILQELTRRKIDGSTSIKPTQLGLDFAPDLCRELTLSVVREAAALNNFVEIDMESSAYTQGTVELFEAVRRQHENVGLAVQSYLYRSEADLKRLLPLHPKIRLVKGAYREPSSIAFPKKKGVDENFGKLMRMLFSDGFIPAIATHDEKMLVLAKEIARVKNWTNDRWEFQMIFGVARNLQEQLVREGYRMRVYIPYGTEWLPYFMRRLSERPANLWFVVKSILKGG